MSDSLILVVFAAFLAAGLIEGLSAVLWWPWFYRSAPRLWRVNASPAAVESAPELAIAESVNSGVWRPVVFRRLSANEIAFRESLLSFRPGVGVSGLITENPAAGILTITTRCSWFLVLGLALAARAAVVEHNVGATCVGVVLLGLFAAQRHRLGMMRQAIESRGL